jgi:hypothetical protein
LLESLLERFRAFSKMPTNVNGHGKSGIRSAEECVYYRLLNEAFRTPEIVLDNVVHWSDRPTQDELSERV